MVGNVLCVVVDGTSPLIHEFIKQEAGRPKV